MTDKIRVCAVQLERQVDFRHSVHKAGNYMLQGALPDFALIGGEYSINESYFSDPYPPLVDLAQSFQCNIIVPVDAPMNRFPDAAHENNYVSMHVFNRAGEVVAIQDKHCVVLEKSRDAKPGHDAHVFEIEGVKIGLVRGMDLLSPVYTHRLSAAEVLFVSTLGVDDTMLETAKVRAFEIRCYVVMSSFIGQLMGQHMAGNAAIIAPEFTPEGIPMQSRVLHHVTDAGLVEAALDLNYIRQIKSEETFDMA